MPLTKGWAESSGELRGKHYRGGKGAESRQNISGKRVGLGRRGRGFSQVEGQLHCSGILKNRIMAQMPFREMKWNMGVS